MPKLRWVLFWSGASLVVAILATAFILETRKVDRLAALVDKRMDELVALSRKNQEMEHKIRYYATDEGLARLAREEFNLFFPDEVVYRIEVVPEKPLRRK